MDDNFDGMNRQSKLKKYFFVIRQMSSRELKRGNASSTLGQLWNVINPIVSMITMSLIFGFVFNHELREFIPYVFTGTIVFGFYDNGMRGCMNALTGNKTLLIRTQIPQNVQMKKKIYLAFRRMLFSTIGYVIALIVTGTQVGWPIALVPVVVFLSAMIMLGIGKILAVVNIYFADITYFYQIIMRRLIFYGSAIFYHAENLSPAVQSVIVFNPIYISITAMRACILYNGVPAPGIWIRLVVYAVVTYTIGTIVFKRGAQNVVARL